MMLMCTRGDVGDLGDARCNLDVFSVHSFSLPEVMMSANRVTLDVEHAKALMT